MILRINFQYLSGNRWLHDSAQIDIPTKFKLSNNENKCIHQLMDISNDLKNYLEEYINHRVTLVIIHELIN